MVVESAERAVGEVSAAQVRALDLIVCLASNCYVVCFLLFYDLFVLLSAAQSSLFVLQLCSLLSVCPHSNVVIIPSSCFRLLHYLFVLPKNSFLSTCRASNFYIILLQDFIVSLIQLFHRNQYQRDTMMII